MAGFTSGDITITTGTKTGFTKLTTTTYEITILTEENQSGSLILTIPAGSTTDLAGNPITETTTGHTIDRINPTCQVSYDPSTRTKETVVATLTNCTEPIMVTNNNTETTKTFTENTDFIFTYADEVGNTGQTTATVTRIDRTPVLATTSYLPKTPHSGDITAVITLNGTTGGEAPEGWTTSGTNQYFRTFTGETAQEIKLTGTVEVENYVHTTGLASRDLTIDRKTPTCQVEYSPAKEELES
jgi:hypothetical protein